MASRFVTPFFDSGDGIQPSDGSKLFFFATGTSTPKNTFSDEALATPNANPVIADANGLFSDIWVAEGDQYKVQLKDKNDVQIWEADPINTVFATAAEIESQLAAKILIFDTVALMVAGTKLNIGDIVATAGYTTKGDGGDNRYEIVAAATGTDDGGSFIDLTGITGQAKGLFPGDIINVKQFGAAGDGTTTDTTALQNALTFIPSTGDSLYIPVGTYISGALTRSAPITLFGDGMGITVLRFNATDGITISSSNGNIATYISNLTFVQDGAGVNTALTIDNTGQLSAGVIQNRTSPRLKVENVEMKGTTSVATDGWLNGLVCTNVLHATVDGLHFAGHRSGTPDNIISSQGIRFDGSGSPVEILITNSWVFFAINAIRIVDCEGVFIDHCNLVAVGTGIRFEPAALEPQLQITDNHINAFTICIFADNLINGNISDNLLFARDDAVANVTGIRLSLTSFSKVSGNIFVNTSGFDFNLIVVVSGGEDVVIKENIFRSGTTAILLQASSSKVEVGYNTFGAVSTEITDSGTTNLITESTQATIGAATRPDGLAEKWGSSPVTLNAGGDGSITFATAFPNNFFTGIVSNGDPATSGADSFVINQSVSSTTTLSFSVRPNPGAIAVTANWTAKGN